MDLPAGVWVTGLSGLLNISLAISDMARAGAMAAWFISKNW